MLSVSFCYLQLYVRSNPPRRWRFIEGIVFHSLRKVDLPNRPLTLTSFGDGAFSSSPPRSKVIPAAPLSTEWFEAKVRVHDMSGFRPRRFSVRALLIPQGEIIPDSLFASWECGEI